jgi:hypothetical protein
MLSPSATVGNVLLRKVGGRVVSGGIAEVLVVSWFAVTRCGVCLVSIW